MDIGQLKHELARHKKLDLERTVSTVSMYVLPQSRRRCGRSCSWYPGTRSPRSYRRFVSCGTPVLGCRGRLGGSLVSPLPCAWLADLLIIVLLLFGRRPRRTTCTQIRPIDRILKRTTPSPLYASAPGFAMTNKQTLLSKAEA